MPEGKVEALIPRVVVKLVVLLLLVVVVVLVVVAKTLQTFCVMAAWVDNPTI
jgi:hypothetical protein